MHAIVLRMRSRGLVRINLKNTRQRYSQNRWKIQHLSATLSMAPKERRKGKKEIHRDNVETQKFYQYFSLVGTGMLDHWFGSISVTMDTSNMATQVVHCLLFYWWSTEFSIVWNALFVVFAVLVHLASHKLLNYMARPLLGTKGELVEAGADLSSSFISEYAIDIIILTTLIQGVTILSNYFWLLWLLAPSYIFYKLWVSLIWPWFMSGSPDPSPGTEGKKQKNKQKFRRH